MRSVRISVTGLGATVLVLLATGCTSSSHPSLPQGTGDGGQPDAAYRYVRTTAGTARTPEPTTARLQTSLSPSGVNALPLAVNSWEQGPQVSLSFPGGSLRAGPTTRVVITARPLAPMDPLPTIVGNVYAVAARPDRGALQVRQTAGKSALVQLRIPQLMSAAGEPEALPETADYVIEQRIHDRWIALPTTRDGDDIVQAPLSSLGDYVIVETS